jgi:hypothetical protein
MGHEGVEKTLPRLKEVYFWPGMKRDVNSFVKTCFKGQHYRSSSIPKGTSIIPTIIEWPFIHIDLDIYLY